MRLESGRVLAALAGVVVLGAGLALMTARPARLDAASVAPDEKAQVGTPDEPPVLQEFMRRKLVASNHILEGLCIDDLAMVQEASDVLLKMSGEEKWRASNDMLYQKFSVEFTDAVKELRDKAEGQSSDGAALAWINVTMKCLKCHEWVRNTIVADGQDVRLPDNLNPAAAVRTGAAAGR